MTSGGQPVLQLAYTHDAANRLTRLADALAGQSVDYAYDAADSLLAANGSNGARTTYRYDADLRGFENLEGLAAVDRIYAGTYHKGLFVTTDGGTTWANPLPAVVAALTVTPGSPATVYAGTWVGGAYKSTNSGATWAPASAGLGADDAYALAVDPAATNTIYAGTGTGVWQRTVEVPAPSRQTYLPLVLKR
jgi:hypothetical protein